VDFGGGAKLTLSMGRYQDKISGQGVHVNDLRAVLESFSKCRDHAANYGSMMERVKSAADSAEDVQAFTRSLLTLTRQLRSEQAAEAQVA
jgi:methylthioribose-1-phosphate isomerase